MNIFRKIYFRGSHDACVYTEIWITITGRSVDFHRAAIELQAAACTTRDAFLYYVQEYVCF